MSKMLERLSNDLKTAMKSRDEVRLSVLRMCLAKVKEKQVEPGREADLDDVEVQQLLATYCKQRKEAAEAFANVGREDLRDKELQERDIVMAYLPEQLDDDAVREVLKQIIDETGADSMRDMGKVMGPAMQRLRGRVEGARVQQLLREALES